MPESRGMAFANAFQKAAASTSTADLARLVRRQAPQAPCDAGTHKEAVMADEPAGDKPEDKPDPKVFNRPEDEAGKKALDEERKARRDAERQLKEMAETVKALQDKDKSDSERLTEKVTQLEKDLARATAKADRFEVALEKGLDMTRAKRLTGETREELEADADELTTWQAGSASPTPSKPTTDLRGGGDPTEEPDVDIRQVVDAIPRGV